MIYDFYSWFILDKSNEFRTYEIPLVNIIKDDIHYIEGKLAPFSQHEVALVKQIFFMVHSETPTEYDYSVKKIGFIQSKLEF